jgi:hypothetical protein
MTLSWLLHMNGHDVGDLLLFAMVVMLRWVVYVQDRTIEQLRDEPNT